MLMTDTFSPLHRRSPASHSFMVCGATVASSPTRTHTSEPGVEQFAESLQRHSLLWANKTSQISDSKKKWKHLMKLWIAYTLQRSYHHSPPTCDSCCSLLCCVGAMCSRCTLQSGGFSPCIATHAFCTQTEEQIVCFLESWHTTPARNWRQKGKEKK